MPRMGEQTRQERRQEWIDAAWRSIAQKGYRSMTVDDVCAEAGLSKGSFYTHFNQKQDLLFALLDEEATGIEDLIADVGENEGSGTERIRAFLRALTSRGEDQARVQLRADLWAEVSADDDLRKRFAETVRQRRLMLAGWVKEAVDAGQLVEVPPNAFAAILVALADGLMVHAALDPGGFRWANIRQAVSVVLDHLEPGAASG